MMNYNISISYAKEMLDDFTIKKIKMGYKESTIKEEKKKTLKFLNSYDDNLQINAELIDQYIDSYRKKGYSITHIRSITSSLKVYYDYLCTNEIHPSRKQSISISFSNEDSILADNYMSNNIGELNKHTVQVKRKYIWRFLNDIKNSGIATEELDESFVNNYILGKPYRYVSFIKSFLNFLFKKGLIKKDLSLFVHLPKMVKKTPSVYSKDELQKIIDFYKDDTLVSMRNKAIVILAITTGLRSCDIANIKYSDFDLKNNKVNVVQIKTGMPISLYINDQLKELIYRYNSIAVNRQQEFLFVNERAPFRPISTGSIRYILKKAIINLGLKKEGRKIGPHSMRSSFATALAQDEVSYDVIEKLLGHKNDSSISSYVLTDIEKLRKCALPTYIPTGNFKKWLGE